MPKSLKILLSLIFVISAVVFLPGYKLDFGAFTERENTLAEERILAEEPITVGPDKELNSPEIEVIKNTPISNNQLEQKNTDAPRDLSLKKWAEWSESHGYFNSSDHSVYLGYELKTLAELAKQNDPLATQVLAQKLVISKDFKKALPIYTHAGVLGSTSSLKDLANLMVGIKAFKEDLHAYYELSVLSKFADMRGDAIASEAIAKMAAKYSLPGVPVPDALLHKIDTAAQQYYSKLEEQRLSLGLGKFDDSRLLAE